ncbi:MAG TPA: Xaa-Pro peptidase family protein [Lichenihabitans sp.]|jgi:Xaa-Pro aminopeptidase|nr:Xaa-Pro peptidase family protein [Lichenihabitans sp.]
MSRILDMARERPPHGPTSEARQAAPLGLDIAGRIAGIDKRRLRRDRLAQLRAELARRDYAGALLADPMNIRYATDARNMAVWTMHAPGRYVFVATDGPVILFEFGTCFHLNDDLDVVDEMRASVSWFYFLAGPRVAEKTAAWAAQVIDLMGRHGGSNRRLAIDRCEPWGAQHLIDAGIRLFDAQEPLEQARMIKTPDEIKCMQLSMDVCDIAVERMRGALRPGITENQLWSVLHETNIAHDGEWIECRLLASGNRTNPWFQESGNRVIQAGEIVGFDTDMVGPFGYLADISRSWVCPDRRPTDEQRALYDIAQEQVLTNIALIKPGLSLREFSERCWPVPERYVPNRYMMMIHGAGMVDEYPIVVYAADWEDWGYDAHFEENMVVCVESYIGEVGGKEGVKLEQQVLITAAGAVPMSSSPFVDAIEP